MLDEEKRRTFGSNFTREIDQSTMNLVCVGDLKRFYSTPVDNTTPYEALGKIDLPKNLHILQNYHRFHPGETFRLIYATTGAVFTTTYGRVFERSDNSFSFILSRYRHDVQRQNGVPEKLHPRHRSEVQKEISWTHTGEPVVGRADEDLNDY